MLIFSKVSDLAFNLQDKNRIIHEVGSSWTHIRKYRKSLKEEWIRRFENEMSGEKDPEVLSDFWYTAITEAQEEKNSSAERYFTSRFTRYQNCRYQRKQSDPVTTIGTDYPGMDAWGTPFNFTSMVYDDDYKEKCILYQKYQKYCDCYVYHAKTKSMSYALFGKFGSSNPFHHRLYRLFWFIPFRLTFTIFIMLPIMFLLLLILNPVYLWKNFIVRHK